MSWPGSIPQSAGFFSLQWFTRVRSVAASASRSTGLAHDKAVAHGFTRRRKRPMVRSDREQKAEEFRRYAALCSKMAEQMSNRENRNRMLEMAQHFLQLAQKEAADTE